jgi:hypothetical protein
MLPLSAPVYCGCPGKWSTWRLRSGSPAIFGVIIHESEHHLVLIQSDTKTLL